MMSDTWQPLSVTELQRMATTIRCDVIEMVAEAKAGHPGGSLSAADMVTALYFRIMRVDPRDPTWPDRDRFILSKGHACPVWYAALAERGFFDRAHLKTLRRMDSILQGHADMLKTPGVDMSVGSLGQGFSAGIGMALSGKLRRRDYHVWVMVGDGECQEGAIWEAAMSGARWQLDNLTVIVDKNGLQNDSFIHDIMPVEPLADKWRAFCWNVVEIDGHDMEQIVATLDRARAARGAPTAIVATTVKGKGVSFMENKPAWHGKAPNAAETAIALRELRGEAA